MCIKKDLRGEILSVSIFLVKTYPKGNWITKIKFIIILNLLSELI